MGLINDVDEAIAYASAFLDPETDWEDVKPLPDCPRVHFNNEDRDALRLLTEEVNRLREINAALTEHENGLRAAALNIIEQWPVIEEGAKYMRKLIAQQDEVIASLKSELKTQKDPT